MSDLFQGLWAILGRSTADLDATIAHFIRDVVVLCFTRHRSLYEEEGFQWMAIAVQKGCTGSQAYLALHALPDKTLEPCTQAILGGLTGPFLAEAKRMIAP